LQNQVTTTLLTIEGTRLWNATLAEQAKSDKFAEARQRLRNTFLRFRERAALLAAEIHSDLPELTVHDVTHLDALWDIADIIVGDPIVFNPVEAFVFGGAVLLHDLGMALAAYPGGLTELKKETLWTDSVAREFHDSEGRLPTTAEIQQPPEHIRLTATASVLRSLHAKRAEQLPNVFWKAATGDAPQYLIEDTEIRQVFGRTIGLIAHSHWWPLNRVEGEFVRPLGSPTWCPNEWRVDSLKVACLLRAVDAAHLDARRAPSFLRALRHPSGHADDHWKFQEKLQKPYLADDALGYSSGYAFPLADAPAWWLCLETLSNADKELRQIDTLLAEKHLQRFAARRVAGVESPERLVHYIPTDGWSPIAAYVHVSDVPHLVKTLGGKELYGRDKSIAFRELIQNGADAVRARRLVENRSSDWGAITVRHNRDGSGEWIKVEDSGVGMSRQVLVKYLLDFGASYWGSPLMLEEFPGLLSRGFQPAGKYGIGFFSVFMLGKAIRVRTRLASAAQQDTQILEFNTGLSAKPILRVAAENERIRDGGTSVRVWLDEPLSEILSRRRGDPTTLDELCLLLCPSIDVSVFCEHDDLRKQVVSASDWMSSAPEEILHRAGGCDDEEYAAALIKEAQGVAAKLIQDVREEDGTLVGRACILNAHSFAWEVRERYPMVSGIVTVGGLAATTLRGIGGILVGRPEQAARDVATPLATAVALGKWSTDQARAIENLVDRPEVKIACAEIVWRCGGDTGALPVCRFRGEWLSSSQLAKYDDLPAELFLVSPLMIRGYSQIEGFQLGDNVIETESLGVMTVLSAVRHTDWPDELVHPDFDHHIRGSLVGAVMEAVAKAWGVAESKIRATTTWRRESDREIGRTSTSVIRERVTVLKRPLV
jgi:hypothetical protein